MVVQLDHWSRASERMHADAHPDTSAFLAMTLDERWVLRSVEAMTRTAIAMWRERFALVVEDLLAWPHDGPILAEGPGLFPECVAPLLSSPQQALWLVPDDAFKRAIFPTREDKMATSEQTSDPPRARWNMIGRDLMLGEHIKDQAGALGLSVFDVDGTCSIDESGCRHRGALSATARFIRHAPSQSQMGARTAP